MECWICEVEPLHHHVRHPDSLYPELGPDHLLHDVRVFSIHEVNLTVNWTLVIEENVIWSISIAFSYSRTREQLWIRFCLAVKLKYLKTGDRNQNLQAVLITPSEWKVIFKCLIIYLNKLLLRWYPPSILQILCTKCTTNIGICEGM